MYRLSILKTVLAVLLSGVVASATPARIPGSPATTAAAAVPAKPRVMLSKYQLESGLIQTFAGGTVADPYFGLYALSLARAGGLDVTHAQARFIAWGLRDQSKDGTFSRYCKKAGVWASCGKSDSDDATLARWMHLLYSAAPRTAPLPALWAASAQRAETALLALRMKSGVYSVFPKDTPGYAGYALFKDNVEVFSVFTQLSVLFAERGEPERAAEFARHATDLREAMKRNFGDKPFAMKRISLAADYDKWLFYPHAVSIPFGWLEGYYAPPTVSEWTQWENSHTQAWLANAKKDFPWGLMALAALKTGNPAVAGCWVQRHRNQSVTGQHWNVLEEVSLQILVRAKPMPKNCPAYAP